MDMMSRSSCPKGYKQTEVGVIPEDWEVVCLSDVLDGFQNGYAFSAQAYTSSGVPIVTMAQISLDGSFQFDEAIVNNWDDEEAKKLKAFFVNDGDVIVSMTDVTPSKNLIGRMALTKLDKPALLNQRVGLLRLNRDRILPGYLVPLSNQSAWRSYCKGAATLGVQANIGTKELKNGLIPLPPTKAEQEAIAEALSDADALIASLEHLITKKRRIKQGAMQELLTSKKRLPGFEIKSGTKQTEVGVIPNDWEAKQIQEVCDFIVPGRNRPRVFNGDIPWITTPDLEDGRNVHESRLSLRVSISEAKAVGSKVVPEGSVLMSCVGELGIVALAGRDIVINQQLHAFLPTGAINPVFLVYAIKTQASYIESVATKTALPYLNKENCNSIPIPLPPLAEQEAIADALSDMDTEIDAIQSKLTKARQLKQGPPTQTRHDAQPADREDSPGMTTIGTPERVTQDRVITLFREELGYDYLGDWQDRADNSNIEEDQLTAYLKKTGYSAEQIARALHALRTEANNPNRSLYDNNKTVYGLLRYGVPVKAAAGENTETVKLINWDEPAANDFALAQEVTLKGNHERRPDLVLYINGIAVGVIELKNSRVSIGDGIRQNISNQQKEFNQWFFGTVQFVFAGNDSEGLKYGTIGTPEKYYLQWKEDEADNTRFTLDKYLLKMCAKDRLIELIHDFVLFDGGIKKLPRVHQYFAVKAAQQRVDEGKGGIIWHTQGSGKSIVMVLLAKWMLEHQPNARVAIVTDRDDLDKQIESVFSDAGEDIYRTRNGSDLMTRLGHATPRLICSLVHKFGKKEVDNFEQFITELEAQPCHTVGDIFVFVDECHRTQSGKLHRTMKAIMPHAAFIGFTGTPLLKKDQQTSLEVFGRYIHTYKFTEGVEDKVILDLVYEARDIDQRIGSEDNIDAWFEAKTRGLNDWQKGVLREQWGTMQQVLSSRSRMDKVVQNIELDFAVKPRLANQRGTAMLIAASIYEACKYFALFQRSTLKDNCAVITSYSPLTQDIALEDTGANTETDKEFIYHTYTELLKNIDARPGKTKTETYEEDAKDLFKKQPANMKLLIVVDKLLTGFDAPSCTYLYIDKSMQDHGLFQAICRTNRLDGDDKEFGYIVDYKDLFKKVEKAIAVYTAELDQSDGGPAPEILLHDRLTKGRERLENAREAIALLCEPVEPPKGELEYIHYFCGNTELPADLAAREPQRVALYKATVLLVRAFANIADELEAAGYSPTETNQIKQDLDRSLKLREVIRKASGETIDLKAYEADMRHLISPLLMADRQPIQLIPPLLPVRKEAIQYGGEPTIVTRLNQVS